MSVLQTSAFVAEVETKYASGRQRFIRHVFAPDNAPAMMWDHPETLCDHCDACKSEFASLGREKRMQLHRDEAPMEIDPLPADKVTVPGVSSVA